VSRPKTLIVEDRGVWDVSDVVELAWLGSLMLTFVLLVLDIACNPVCLATKLPSMAPQLLDLKKYKPPVLFA
jgi:hypothetical protein